MARSLSTQEEVRRADEIMPTRGTMVIEKLLKILAWQIGIILFLLAYLAFARPQPGRFQFVALRSGEVVLYDTATGRALYQKPEIVPADSQQGEGGAAPEEEAPGGK